LPGPLFPVAHTAGAPGGPFVQSLAFSPDGKLLAVGMQMIQAGARGEIHLWDVAAIKEVGLIKVGGSVRTLHYLPDGTGLVAASENEVRVWDAATRAEKFVCKGHKATVTGVALSPDGSTLASSSQDGTVKVWDAKTGALLRTLEGHTNQVQGIACGPDGKLLASAGTDSSVRLWDAETGKQRAVVTLTPNARAASVAFRPDGKVLSAAVGREVKCWDVTKILAAADK
jgi:WD40 repeat protein